MCLVGFVPTCSLSGWRLPSWILSNLGGGFLVRKPLFLVHCSCHIASGFCGHTHFVKSDHSCMVSGFRMYGIRYSVVIRCCKGFSFLFLVQLTSPNLVCVVGGFWCCRQECRQGHGCRWAAHHLGVGSIPSGLILVSAKAGAQSNMFRIDRLSIWIPPLESFLGTIATIWRMLESIERM